jgi:pilus assembly protein CpaB
VTLEVDVTDGQKLALASAVGTLSLLLRKAGEMAEDATRRVTLTDLGRSVPSADSRFVTVEVLRASKRQNYSVPTEHGSAHAVALSGRE